MTDQQHPITPPPNLVEQWWDAVPGTFTYLADEMQLATAAAQWGADQELEACCEWLSWRISRHMSEQLRDTRRPKPQSETDLALTDLEHLLDVAKSSGVFNPPDNIRRCLERLKKLEEATND